MWDRGLFKAEVDEAPVTQGETYTFLGKQFPREHFDDKLGSYWTTVLVMPISVLMLGIVMTVLVGTYNHWSPISLVPCLAVTVTGTILTTFTTCCPFVPPPERAQYLKAAFSPACYAIFNVSRFVFYLSSAAWNCVLFIVPPLETPVLATAPVVLFNVLGYFPFICAEVSLRDPRCWSTRMTRASTIASSWLEFGSDFASGITALHQGSKGLGIAIIMGGMLEFVMNVHIVKSGMVSVDKKHMWAHMLLEVPIIISTCLAIEHAHKPVSQQPAHLVSLLSTFVTFTATFMWLYIIQPLFYPSWIPIKSTSVHPSSDHMRISPKVSVAEFKVSVDGAATERQPEPPALAS